MTNHSPSNRRLAQHLGVLVATAALASAAHAATFSTSIELHALDGSLTPGGQAAGNTPLSSSLANAANSGLKGSAAVDMGVLKASAAAPAWHDTASASYTYYQASASASYSDTLTFTRPGGGFVPVTFTFAFDGRVLDPSADSSHRAGLDLSMTLVWRGGQHRCSRAPRPLLQGRPERPLLRQVAQILAGAVPALPSTASLP